MAKRPSLDVLSRLGLRCTMLGGWHNFLYFGNCGFLVASAFCTSRFSEVPAVFFWPSEGPAVPFPTRRLLEYVLFGTGIGAYCRCVRMRDLPSHYSHSFLFSKAIYECLSFILFECDSLFYETFFVECNPMFCYVCKFIIFPR